jgi:hypothetical protein
MGIGSYMSDEPDYRTTFTRSVLNSFTAVFASLVMLLLSKASPGSNGRACPAT